MPDERYAAEIFNVEIVYDKRAVIKHKTERKCLPVDQQPDHQQ
jgi:hypothetical protein